MPGRRFLLFLALALALFAPGTTAAVLQAGRDSGEFLILGAKYGTERHHVDVTQRLREAARRDHRIKVDNWTLGGDPHPGVAKALRIYARGPGGRVQMFEYRENGFVDGARFRGWNRGDWATGGDTWKGPWDFDEGEFLILSAQYGTQHRHVDVTARLKDLARSDRDFRIGNKAFGVDPHPGVVKVLRIYARGPNGAEQMFEYREDSVIDGSRFRGWGRGEWGSGKDRWSGHWDGGRR